MRVALFISILAAASACGGSGAPVGGADSGTMMGADGGRAADGGRRDAGRADPCAAGGDNAIDTVGCNGGFVSETAAANGALGTCMVGGEAMPAGSCTTAGAVCLPSAMGSMTGFCTFLCTPGATYVTRGECPMGWRCFDLGDDFGLCYLDCDATHACPSGYQCDEEGSCVPGGAPPADAGTPMTDAGMSATDGGMPATDAGTPPKG